MVQTESRPGPVARESETQIFKTKFCASFLKVLALLLYYRLIVTLCMMSRRAALGPLRY